jgi:hypothetical protein
MGYSLKTLIRKDKINNSGECPIIIRITIGKEYYRHPIGESIKPKDWNEDDEIPKKNAPNREIIRTKIDFETSKIRDLINKFFHTNNKKYPTLLEIKKILKNNRTDDGILKNRPVMDYYKEFVENYSKKNRLAKGTIKVYRATELRLNDYFKELDITPTWEIFDEIFYQDFVSHYIDKGYKEGSIGRIIKNIKTFLGYIHTNYKLINPEKFKDFKVIKEQPEFIIFSKDELLLMKFNLGLVQLKSKEKSIPVKLKIGILNERELQILRIMMFLCFCGLSYVDFQRLKYTDIEKNTDLGKGDSLSFVYVRQKTNISNKVYITLTEDLVEILLCELFKTTRIYPDRIINLIKIQDASFQQKNKALWQEIDLVIKGNGKLHKPQSYKQHKLDCEVKHFPFLFPRIPNQTFNKEIKDVLMKIGIVENFKLYEKRYGKVEEIIVPKYSLVTSVTGRRTFITQSLEDGIPYEVLMKSTGHKDIKTLMRYARIDQGVVNNEFLLKKKKLTPTEDWEKKQKILQLAKELGIDPRELPGTGKFLL